MMNNKTRVVVQLFFIVVLANGVIQTMGLSYEETMEEMLIQCSSTQQSSTTPSAPKTRIVHECEKNDPDGDYKYSIATLKTRYSKREFLCTFFSKAEDVDVELAVVFSHANFTMHSVSVWNAVVVSLMTSNFSLSQRDTFNLIFSQYGLATLAQHGSLVESKIDYQFATIVALPDKKASKLDIIEWKINGANQCPACGEKSKSKGLISGGNETSIDSWPWHASLWRQTTSGIRYICGATILNKKWIITAGCDLLRSLTRIEPCQLNRFQFQHIA